MTTSHNIIAAALDYAYESEEATMKATDRHFIIKSKATGAVVHMERVRPDRPIVAAALMLEVDEPDRVTLGLPECEAVTGGTALCFRSVERSDVPMPKAPTCWDELVSAELWPMAYLGATADGEPTQAAMVPAASPELLS